MSGFADELKKAFVMSLWDQSELAAKTGYSVSMVDKVLNGRPGPSVKAIAAVAKALNVPFEIQMQDVGDGKKKAKLANVGNEIIENIREESDEYEEPPTFTLSLHASDWTDPPDNYDWGERVSTQELSRKVFRVRIDGDCMAPKYQDGMTIEFRLLTDDLGCPDFSQLELNKDYYIQLNDGRATFKQLVAVDLDGMVFSPRNKKLAKKKLRATSDEVTRIGRVVFYGYRGD